MGYAIAKTAALRGADVTLVSGPAEVEPPMFVNFVPVVTAKDMFEAVTGRSDEMDAVIKAAAVADYRPKFVNTEKTKKKDGDMAIELERTDDILKWLGEHKKDSQFLCGFSMETEHMLENSRAKLKKKNLDMIGSSVSLFSRIIVTTFVSVPKPAPATFRLLATIISKEEVAGAILDEIFGIER